MSPLIQVPNSDLFWFLGSWLPLLLLVGGHFILVYTVHASVWGTHEPRGGGGGYQAAMLVNGEQESA